MLFEFGLKDKSAEESNFKIKYSETNIGYDCLFSRKLVLDDPKQIFFECDEYYLFDKQDPKMLVKDIVKLSNQEKALFKRFFEFLKELPITNLDAELEKYFLQYLEENRILLDNDQKKYLLKLIDYEINSLGPISALLKDKDKIEEITIIGLGIDNPVYAYVSNIGWTKTNFYFTNE